MTKQTERTTVAPRGTLDGKPIVDADEPLTIKIQKSDLRKAKRNDPGHCAAAESIRRQEHPLDVRIWRSKILVEYPDKVVRYQTPSKLRFDTISFDRGAPRKFMEGDYTLYPPPKHQRLGNDKRKSTRGGGRNKQPAKRRPPLKGVRPRAPVSF